MASLREMVAGGFCDRVIAVELNRSVAAVQIRRARFIRPSVNQDRSPGWAKPHYGSGRYWTPERTLEGLRDFAAKRRGPLPTSDHEYSLMKKGHMEWPVAQRVLEYHGSMADAWAAAGVSKARYNRLWVTWTAEDDDYLLDHAGAQTLKVIAKSLGRSWGACKRRLYDLEAGRARDVAGYLSAMQVAKEYNCPLSRVTSLIAAGTLPAKKVVGGHYWRIEPADCEAIKAVLSAPKKKSYQGTPPDLGDYDRRFGYIRRTVNGKVVRQPRGVAS